MASRLSTLGVGGLVGGVSPPPPPTVYLRDNFTGADGTLLPAHTMDVGGGWTALAGSYDISGNKARSASNTDGDLVTADALHSDYTLTYSATATASSPTDIANADIAFRIQDANNHLLVDVNAGAGQVSLFSKILGAFTLLGFSVQTIVSGSTHTVGVRCSGTTVVVTYDGADIITVTVATFSALTLIGLRFGTSGSPPAGCRWDSLLVVP